MRFIAPICPVSEATRSDASTTPAANIDKIPTITMLRVFMISSLWFDMRLIAPHAQAQDNRPLAISLIGNIYTSHKEKLLTG
jgi:hypothetical protein